LWTRSLTALPLPRRGPQRKRSTLTALGERGYIAAVLAQPPPFSTFQKIVTGATITPDMFLRIANG